MIFLQILITTTFIYVQGSLHDFYWKKCTHESPYFVSPYFNVERIKMIEYLSNILKHDTPNDDMKEKIEHWLGFFEKFYKTILLCLKNHTILLFLNRVDTLQLYHHPVSLIKKMKQDFISMQPYKYYIKAFF